MVAPNSKVDTCFRFLPILILTNTTSIFGTDTNSSTNIS